MGAGPAQWGGMRWAERIEGSQPLGSHRGPDSTPSELSVCGSTVETEEGGGELTLSRDLVPHVRTEILWQVVEAPVVALHPSTLL